jgi:ribosomal protein S18 acetylase RimI-like enzyme
MSSEPVCRVATAGDVPFLWAMLLRASREDDDPSATVARAMTDPGLVRYVDGWGRPGDVGVIAAVDGVDVGAAWARLLVGSARESPAFVDEATPELAVAVAAGAEGRGIGTTLLRALLDLLHGSVEAVTLNARDDNPAIALYERFGFVEIGEIVNRVGTRSIKMLLRFG